MSKAKYISKLVDASGSTTSANVSYTGTLTGSTGILNIGSGQLYKDASGNVGIGTSSPDSVLSVYAANKTIPAISARYSAAGFKAGFSVYNVNGYPYLSFNVNPVTSSNSGTYDITGVASKIDFASSASSADIIFSNAISGTAGTAISWLERMRIDSSGNVGIGTSSPAKKLDVLGEAQISFNSINTYLYYQSTNNYTGRNTDGNMWMNVAGGYSNIFGVAGSEKMRIDSSGNVGIGTSVNSVFDNVGAARPLVVQSSSSATTPGSSTNAITISNSNTTTNNVSQLNFAAITGASINQYSSAWIACQYGARTNGQYPTGTLIFATSTALNLAPSEKLRIDSSGNVGIGVTPPNSNLSGSLYGPNSFLIGSGGPNFHILSNAYYNSGYKYAASGEATWYKQQTGQHIWYNAPSGTAGNAITFTQAMTLDASGNVGIGTSSPTNISGNGDLTVLNRVFAGVANASYPSYSFIGRTDSGMWSPSASTIAFSTGFTERMRIDSSGNVGIGTSSTYLSSKFTSLNTTNTPAGVFIRPITITNAISVENSYIYMRGQDNGYGLAIGNYSSTQWIQGMVNDAPSLDIALNPSGGNVGIGTTAPQGKFQVLNEGSLATDTDSNTTNTIIAGNNKTATSNQGNLFIYSNSTATDGFGGSIGFGGLYSGSLAAAFGRIAGVRSGGSFAGALTFYSRATDGTMPERMRINSSGDVGIGTVSNAGNTLRYLDIQNTDTGASAGAIIRLITNNSASTAVTTADIVKYKNGLFSINNNDTGQIALNIAGSNRLYINSGESMILRSNAGSTAAYDSYHTNINGMSLAVNRFTSSNGDIGDWPTPVLAIKGYDSNFHGLTMQTFGSRDDNAGYQTGSAIWNIRLWNDAGGTWTTSNSSTSMEVKGPGPYRIQAGASNGVQLTNGATSWTAWSDENMKDIIEPITDALQKVSTLRTVIGKYKKEADGIRRPFLIAQDVEKVLPEAVTVSIERDEINSDDIYAELEQRERLLLSYTDVIPLLTASIKELKIIIDAQQEQINSLLGK